MLKLKIRHWFMLVIGLLALISAPIVLFDIQFPRLSIVQKDTFHKILYFGKRDRDIARVRDLEAIQVAIEQFVKEMKRLPRTLEELKQASSGSHLSITDPKTHDTYIYAEVPPGRVSTKQPVYNICATFEAPTPIIEEYYTPFPPCVGMCSMEAHIRRTNPIDPTDDSDFWDHYGPGTRCWTQESIPTVCAPDGFCGSGPPEDEL